MTKLHFSILLLALIATVSVHAQDLVIKKNGDEIRCKVIELGIEKITYTSNRDNDSLATDTFFVKKEDLFMIRYENGTKDVFTNSTPEPDYVTKPQYAPAAPLSEKITVKGRRYSYQNRPISKYRVNGLLRGEHDKAINSYVAKSVVCSVFAPLLKFASIPVGVIGFFILGIQSQQDSRDIDLEARNVAIGSVTGFILAQAGGYTVEFFQYKNQKEAVKLYNAKH